MHDIIIVGGGIAGLRVGIEVLREKPDADVIILEKYDYIGGRVVTHYKGGNQWEIGAGRISTSHRRVLELIDQYNLTWADMTSSAEFRREYDSGSVRCSPDQFTELAKLYLDPLRRLSPTVLRRETVASLLVRIHGQKNTRLFIQQFPYWSEMHTLRADLALESFSDEMESWRGFGSCKEGLGAIIRGMVREFKHLGGKIHLNTEVIDVIHERGCEHVLCKGDRDVYMGRAVVLALHRDAVATMKHLRSWHVLRHLRMNPLLRMYAVFPKQSGHVWFEDVPKTITNSRLRFVIPIDPKRGTIMVSYTDGDDAKYWMSMKSRRGADAVREEVMTELRTLFSEIDIPDPIEFKLYPWYNGCTYWLPGNYDPATMSKEALCIRPTLFCCGESFSLRQAWMEGALEHADMLLHDRRFRDICFR
jgi:glycine/D-amino acid oxidase-like deaminating enzyme